MTEYAKREPQKNIPGFVYPLLFVAGALPLWPFLWGPFALRARRSTRLWILLFPIVILTLPLWLSWNWLLLAPVMAAANALFAVVFLLAHPPHKPQTPIGGKGVEPTRSESITGWSRLRLTFAITLCGLPFGLILVSIEQWLTDALWSMYYPVNASIDSISYEVGTAWVLFAFVFAFTVFHVTPKLHPASPGKVLRLLLWTFIAYLIVHQVYLLLVIIPEWQTEMREIFPPWVLEFREIVFHLLVYVSVPAALGILFQAGRRRHLNFAAGLASIVLSLAALACVSGMPIHYALLLGQQAEKNGRPAGAIPYYSRALTWSQSDVLKSYLQFRVGLLYRKTGQLEEARDAFTRVLVRYPADETLLDDADEFKEKLSAGKATTGKRVVIPGIEARTEYKSAYCVPNSLGLILNFWGDRTGAKRIGSEITQLDHGSLITDEVHFAESRGFASLVLPLCTLDQLHKLIDAGIPVLTFIPGHVLAVFGYDEALGTLVTYDVSTFDIWDDERSTHFASDWSQSFNTVGIVVPKNLLPKVREVLGADVDKRSEAYISYLLSQLVESDPGLRIKRLQRSFGFDYFPAGWEYRALSGDTAARAVEDSLAQDFLLTHEVDDQSSYIFALDLLWRGHNQQAFDFLKQLGERKPLSGPLVITLAGAELRTGNPVEAEGILLHSVSLENMDPAPAAFLLRHVPKEEAAGEWVGRLSLQMLGRDELHGDEARLAYQTWRSVGAAESNLDESLDQIHGYLEHWQPYDTTAIGDLRDALSHKTFRSNQETDERVWKKQSRLYEVRRARLQWATDGSAGE